MNNKERLFPGLKTKINCYVLLLVSVSHVQRARTQHNNTEKTPENNRRQAQIKFNEKMCRVI